MVVVEKFGLDTTGWQVAQYSHCAFPTQLNSSFTHHLIVVVAAVGSFNS